MKRLGPAPQQNQDFLADGNRALASTQNRDGSWGYGGSPGTGSMTFAGIASLVMAESQVDEGDALAEDGKIECCVPHRDDL